MASLFLIIVTAVFCSQALQEFESLAYTRYDSII